MDYSNVDELMEQARDFLGRNAIWQEAEEYIVDLRNGYWNEQNKAEQQINEKLWLSATEELHFQYSLWKKDYKSAFDQACKIIGILNAPSLNGYKCFGIIWQDVWLTIYLIWDKLNIKKLVYSTC